MAWIIGIDEAGYGPNLGPFVMTAVACRVPNVCAGDNLWTLLASAVRRIGDANDGRIIVDDSKKVYSTARGLNGLERGVHTTLSRGGARLHSFIERLSPDGVAELRQEVWYQGDSHLPIRITFDELNQTITQFEEACASAGVGPWLASAAVVCTSRFNDILDSRVSKGAVLDVALSIVTRRIRERIPNDEDIFFFIDKHSSRNTYAALIQNALPDGMVVAREEGMARSAYQVYGLGRDVRLTFQPRADSEHFCVALASMTAKYLREVLMLDFNAFWGKQVPGLKPTAGYPGDAGRYLEAIWPVAQRLGIAESALWRRK